MNRRVLATLHLAPINSAYLKSNSYNFETARLAEDAIRRGEAMVAKGGALSAETGIHTGRSPNDKFTVRDALTKSTAGGAITSQ